MAKFDPNAAANQDSGVFGLPYTESEAALVFFPVPWEATTSYGGGTSNGPQAILKASRQVDLYDLDVLKPYEAGLFMLEESADIRALNERARTAAQKVIAVGGQVAGNRELEKSVALVNELGAKLNELVYKETLRLLTQEKLVGLVGGDHSVPLGALEAIAEKHPGYGILHFDAHSDTRDAYEGFEYSHASIMHNVLERISPQSMKKLVQVGIRDVCEEEIEYVASQGKRVQVFYDRDNQRRKIEGTPWATIAKEIVAALPQEVWISFDIDGLDPRFCPNTGTPVAGGMDFAEAVYVIGLLVRSGRKIIGFDLNEVAPDSTGTNEWDANVGARMLYKLAAWTLASQGKAKIQ